MKKTLIAFDNFIWSECKIESVGQLVAFEKKYQYYDEGFKVCYDNEVGEITCIEMQDGPLSLLLKGRFRQFSEGLQENSFGKAFMAAGLTELEALMIMVFLADISNLFRLDAYNNGVPPIAQSLCEILNGALKKLPPTSIPLTRKCNEYDRVAFRIGDIFKPGFCLTTSSDSTWGDDTAANLYRISTLDVTRTRARALYLVKNNTEYQVSFLQEAQFRVTSIKDRGEGALEISMEELE